MERMVFLLALLLAMGTALSGCASSAPSSALATPDPSAPDTYSASSTVPASAAPAIEVTSELLEELVVRMGLTRKDGYDAAGALGEFIESHPDFLFEQVSRLRTNTGNGILDDDEQLQLLAIPGIAPEDDLANRQRLAQFVENYKAGIADSIAIISPADPLPIKVMVYTYDGNGKSYTAEYDTLSTQDALTTIVQELYETDTEWFLINEADSKIRYPKYGYEAIPLGESEGEGSAAEAQKLIEQFAKEKYPEIASVGLTEEQEFGGEFYYRFEGLDANGSNSNIGIHFAVAKDLRCFMRLNRDLACGYCKPERKKQVRNNEIVGRRMILTTIRMSRI